MCAAVRHRLEIYGASFTEPWWEQVRPEVLCLVRRQRPKTEDNCRDLLKAAVGLLREVWDEQGPATLTDALTTLNIERYLRTLKGKNAINQRPTLLRLMGEATGLPDPVKRDRRDPREDRLSQAEVQWMARAQSGAPVIIVLESGCTPDTLRVMSPHLPAGDISSFREVLRG